jgi:hypothetical protein
MVTRPFLGALKAAIAPGFSLITGQWYTRKVEGSLSPWRYFFLIFGAKACFWGVVMLALLPYSHQNAIWLRKVERQVAAHRVFDNVSGNQGTSYQPYQILEAFKDPTTWCLLLYTLCTPSA